jgi:hypothetical protein
VALLRNAPIFSWLRAFDQTEIAPFGFCRLFKIAHNLQIFGLGIEAASSEPTRDRSRHNRAPAACQNAGAMAPALRALRYPATPHVAEQQMRHEEF